MTSQRRNSNAGADDNKPRQPLGVKNSIESPSTDVRKTLAAPRGSASADVEDLAALFPQTGRYRPLSEPIEGGMGVVFKAHDINLDIEVAVKRIRPQLAADPELISRFEREARVQVRLKHSNLVPVRDFAKDHLGPYIVMDWIDGQTLAEVLKNAGPMEWRAAAMLISKVANALLVAHVAGIVHRDVKPGNILLDRHGEPWVTDFGLARIEAIQSKYNETATNAVLMTALYAAPEQQQNPKNACIQSDIFSLGATLYTLLTGHDVLAMREKLIPEQLREIVLKATEREIDARYGSMAEFATALDQSIKPVSSGPPSGRRSRADGRSADSDGTGSFSPSTTTDDLAKLLEETTRAVGRKHDQAKQLLQDHRYSEAADVLGGIPDHLRDQGQWQDAVTRRDRVQTLNEIVRKAVTELRLEGLRRSVEELLSLQPQRQDLASLLARLPEDVESGGQTFEAAVWNRFGAKPRPPLLQSPFDSTQAVSAQEAWAKYLGLGVEVTNSLGMKFRVIPPGTFERDKHTVTISQPKLFGVYPVTQGEWLQVMGKNPAHFQLVSGQDTRRFPVEQVSWKDSQKFLATLNAKHSLPGWRYRLPTEAEWEYACRAGTVTPFSFGGELNGRQANCDGRYPFPGGTTTGPYLERPSVVGSYGANPFGLFDLHGNVWEWCGDWYSEYDLSALQDPTGPSSGSSRVLRGGSWLNNAVFCRSANRSVNDPSSRYSNIGLRVVSELV